MPKRFTQALLVTLTLITSIALADLAPTPDETAIIAPTPSQNMSMPQLTPPAPNVSAKAYVLMDSDSGRVLASKDMDKRLPPASLTKLMTLYVAAEYLNAGRIHLDDQVHISKKAWQMGGSKMFVKAGDNVPLKLLIQGIIVDSGNDACVAVAQYIAGNEDAFAQIMDQTADHLGMKNTHYVDSTGLPHPNHYATPYDLAILARAFIQNFPQYYGWFKQKWLTYNKIKQPNRNRLLWRDPSVDGLKTGHTQSAGFCLIASAKRGQMRLISVVMGTPSDQARHSDSQTLLNYGFRYFETHQIFAANQVVSQVRTWMGNNKNTPLGVNYPLFITIPSQSYDHIKLQVATHSLHAPISKGAAVGTLNVLLNGKKIQSIPLLALKNNKEGGLFRKAIDRISLLFHTS